MTYSPAIEFAPAMAVANQILTITAMRAEGAARVAAYHHALSLRRALAEGARLVTRVWGTSA